MHALLADLADKGFTGAPRPLGFDERGREVLTFLEGETIGTPQAAPGLGPRRGHLDRVARWMRACHQAVADFVPPSGAIWRGGRACKPGLLIVHNDASHPQRRLHQGTLTGFFDWDFAGPATTEWDLAYAAFSRVPLHNRLGAYSQRVWHVLVPICSSECADPGGSAHQADIGRA